MVYTKFSFQPMQILAEDVRIVLNHKPCQMLKEQHVNVEKLKIATVHIDSLVNTNARDAQLVRTKTQLINSDATLQHAMAKTKSLLDMASVHVEDVLFVNSHR
jgi:hypothetical protein